jgi:membrane protein YdbS with pleckstrin-like domain
VKKDTLKPYAFAAVATGTTLWFTGSHWLWAVAGVVAFIAMAFIEVKYEGTTEEFHTDIDKRYKILTQGREVVPVDYHLTHLHRQAHPNNSKYSTVTVVFEGKERS